jgi:hypothetical protein
MQQLVVVETGLLFAARSKPQVSVYGYWGGNKQRQQHTARMVMHRLKLNQVTIAFSDWPCSLDASHQCHVIKSIRHGQGGLWMLGCLFRILQPLQRSILLYLSTLAFISARLRPFGQQDPEATGTAWRRPEFGSQLDSVTNKRHLPVIYSRLLEAAVLRTHVYALHKRNICMPTFLPL